MREISLTGIKPTGDLHIGNYFGAIKPALELAKTYDARYFIADYHALNTMKDPLELNTTIRQVAAGWLAAGPVPCWIAASGPGGTSARPGAATRSGS